MPRPINEKRLASHNPWIWAFAWHPVFGINLILPLMLASGVLDGQGQMGMYCGIVFYWILGFAACAGRPSFGRVLVKGGVIVACSQAVPFLQFAAGIVALEMAVRFEGKSDDVHAFIAVIFTGGFLLGAAYVLGRFAVAFENWMNQPPRPASGPDPSP